MKSIALLLLLASAVHAGPYFRPGFNELAGGVFQPIAGADHEQQGGFVVSAIEHDSKDGGLSLWGWQPGINWHLLNLGYIGSLSSTPRDFLHGKLAAGPSVQTGELAKSIMRFVCKQALPTWDAADRYQLLKAAFAPGQDGLYADIGIYSAVPLNAFGSTYAIRHMKPQLYVAGTLNKKVGAKPAEGKKP